MKKTVSFVLSLLICTSHHTRAISPKKAALRTALCGAASAGVFSLGYRYSDEIGYGIEKLFQHIGQHGFAYALGSIGALGTLIGAAYYIPQTPQYRLYRARKIIDSVSQKEIIQLIQAKCADNQKSETLVHDIEMFYITSHHPHVVCVNRLSYCVESLREALDMIDLVKKEQKDVDSVQQTCEQLRSRAVRLQELLQQIIQIIKSLPCYETECKTYDDLKESQEMRYEISRIADQMMVQSLQKTFERTQKAAVIICDNKQ